MRAAAENGGDFTSPCNHTTALSFVFMPAKYMSNMTYYQLAIWSLQKPTLSKRNHLIPDHHVIEHPNIHHFQRLL